MNKLLELQKRMEAITKGDINPFFNSRYFDINTLLAQLKPHLNELGLTVLQPLTTMGDRMALETIVMDDKEILTQHVVPLPENPDPQKMGSAITYFRRYALQSLFLLQAEDDDANMAKPEKQKAPKKDNNESPF